MWALRPANVGVLTFIILELVDAMVGQRVSKQEEKVGLDMATHNETGL